MFTTKKRVRRVPKALGSNVENGFGVIFLHANEIIMRAWSGYQKQALHLRCSRDVQTRSTFTNRPKHANQHQQNAQKNANYIFFCVVNTFFFLLLLVYLLQFLSIWFHSSLIEMRLGDTNTIMGMIMWDHFGLRLQKQNDQQYTRLATHVLR